MALPALTMTNRVLDFRTWSLRALRKFSVGYRGHHWLLTAMPRRAQHGNFADVRYAEQKQTYLNPLLHGESLGIRDD